MPPSFIHCPTPHVIYHHQTSSNVPIVVHFSPTTSCTILYHPRIYPIFLYDIHGWFTPWTMKSSQGPVICGIGYWLRHGTTSVYTKEKKSQCPWSYPPTWSNMFCDRRGKRGALVKTCKDPWQRIIIIMLFECFLILILFLFFSLRGGEDENTREYKRMMIFFSFFSKLPFLDIFERIYHNHFWCMAIPLGPHSV